MYLSHVFHENRIIHSDAPKIFNVQVKVGNFTVSRKNIARLVMIFVAAKAVSYSIGYFMY